MLPTTQTAISAMLRADPSITADERAAILSAVRNHGKSLQPKATPATHHPPRLLKRREVARRLGCCPRTVDNLARTGSLRRVLLPGRQRGAGFLESDVTNLIEAAIVVEERGHA